MVTKACSCFILCAIFACGTAGAGEPEPDPAELPRIPPKEPPAAAASFQLTPGYRIELVACEPQVVDPVAIAFDEDGRLFVVEMRGYPERRDEALGRIRRLEDRDGDGRYETATVFADNLKWPTGVVCWKGGVFVCASPEILYLGDRDGDGIAEERRVIFTGFGAGLSPLNMQALVNNLQWGPEGRIYGSTASNGGVVRLAGQGGTGLSLRGSDFSFDPTELDLRAESGTAQFGLTFDDFGRRYLCSNSRHLIAVMYSWPWNHSEGLPHPLVSIPVDGGAAEVYRTSGVEPWRVVRTRWRVQGRVRGPVEGGGRAAGYFTSASGLTVFRGEALGEGQRGTVFVGDVGSNLVHQKSIEFPPARVQPVARRPAGLSKSEFLTSTDNWFRPVQCANGPDGALYIVDMYRETIEHPWSIPGSLKKHLDLYSGSDRGRIWRVVREDFSAGPKVQLSRLGSGALVNRLESGNGWERDTAMRLLLERREEGTGEQVARVALGKRFSVRTRAQALRLLRRFRSLTEEELLSLGEEPSPELRREAVRLWPGVDARQLAAWSRDGEAGVRFEAALRSLDPEAEVTVETLERFLTHPGQDPWIRRVAIAAARVHGVVPALVRGERDLAQARRLVQEAGLSAGHAVVGELVVRAREALAQDSVSRDEEEAARWFVANDASSGVADLVAWLVEGKAVDAALAALLRRPAGEWEHAILEDWQRIPVRVRARLLARMSAEAVLGAIEDERLAASEVGFAQKRELRRGGEKTLRRRAEAVFGKERELTRQQATEHYRPALRMQGDGKAGETLFAQRCVVCHKSGESGAGPDLATLRNKGAPMLLENLLVPDREVAPQYLLWEITLRDGSRLGGVIADERAGQLTLWFADGSSRKIARGDIVKLVNLNRSLMPTGLEAGLSLQEMADLLAFLSGRGS